MGCITRIEVRRRMCLEKLNTLSDCLYHRNSLPSWRPHWVDRAQKFTHLQTMALVLVQGEVGADKGNVILEAFVVAVYVVSI